MRKQYLEVSPDVRLYYPRPEFAPALFSLIDKNRKYLRTWMPWADGVTCEDDIRAVLKDNIRYNLGKQKLTTYIYVNNEPAGSVALVHISREHQKAEIGYWLREDLQGRGIMTESIKRLIYYVFKTTAINRLYMKIAPENKSSTIIPKRLGFRYEGTLRQDAIINGKIFDMEIYGLLKEDWLEKCF